MKRLTTEEFIEKAREIHGNKYDYSKTVYTKSIEKVNITCPIHGDFKQSPNSHLNGSGCPICSSNIKLTTEEFIEKAREIHGNKYDYSKVKYVNNETKLTIICPIHGEFEQRPSNHIALKQGCPKCKTEKNKLNLKYTQEEFITKANEVHNGYYDYSKTEYTGIYNYVTIICPIHGEFTQKPTVHLRGSGCPICGRKKSDNAKMLTTEEFVEKSIEIHGNKYDYSKVNYKGYDIPVTIICPTHGEFLQTPDSHLQGKGCNKCSIRYSSAEEEIGNILTEHGLTVITNSKSIIKPYELDIYVPEKNIAIEYNGIRWHTEEFGKDKDYHLNKLKLCNKNNIKLIQIFEDEYLIHKDIVISKILHIFGLCDMKEKIYARNCNIKLIDCKTAKSFLEKNHIQGFSSSTVYIGSFYNNLLIGVMSFKKYGNDWELTRFATDNNYICCGVGGKLFSYFIHNYEFNEIKSFADRRWTCNPDNNLYTKLGFTVNKFIQPDYRYVKNNMMERFHKFNFRKQILHKKYGVPLTMTETEMTKQLGYYRIWDCGLIKYVYQKTF